MTEALEASIGGIESIGESYFPVPMASLRLDTVTDFNLFLMPSAAQGEPVLYRGESLPFTEEARGRLIENRVQDLWVSSKQEKAYRRYVEANLGAVLEDASIPMQARSQTLYTSAQGLVRDVLEDPRSGDLVDRSADMVQNSVDFMFKEGSSFQHLMRVSSFDYYTYTHSVNVFVFSTALAHRLGLPKESILEFGQGALLHDLGKSLLDESIINCKGPLSGEQWVEMKKHPVYADELLREQGVTSMVVLDVVRHHHEKINGSGYPDGLGADEVSTWVRISTIADIFDALTTRRPYKEARDSFPSLKLMQAEMSKELDQDIFRTFINMMAADAASKG
jgi:putative nucleotidyltransferase with HDIG domain